MIASQDGYPLNNDPLDLIEGDLVTGAVVEFSRARTFVCGHELRIFEGATGVHVSRDPGRPKCMTINAPLEAQRRGAALDHAVGVDAVHGVFGERPVMPHGGAEEGALAAVADAGRVEIGV